MDFRQIRFIRVIVNQYTVFCSLDIAVFMWIVSRGCGSKANFSLKATLPANRCPKSHTLKAYTHADQTIRDNITTMHTAHTSAHWFTQRKMSSARLRIRCADRARMTNKQTDLPSWYCSTFTNCTMFSQFMLTVR